MQGQEEDSEDEMPPLISDLEEEEDQDEEDQDEEDQDEEDQEDQDEEDQEDQEDQDEEDQDEEDEVHCTLQIITPPPTQEIPPLLTFLTLLLFLLHLLNYSQLLAEKRTTSSNACFPFHG